MTDSLQQYDVVIAGAGFAGIYAAWQLARHDVRVALIEGGESIGGLMQSRPWKGYWLDNGTQVLDLRHSVANEFLSAILGDDLHRLPSVRFASTVGSSWVEGIERPAFVDDMPALAACILDELRELHIHKEKGGEDAPPSSVRYIDWMQSQYGATYAHCVDRMLSKFLGSDGSLVSATARDSLSMFQRPSLGTDQMMLVLKQTDDFWNDRLGVSERTAVTAKLSRSLAGTVGYPRRGGMRRFCTAAHQQLESLGVDVLVNAPLTRLQVGKTQIKLQAGDTELSCARLYWSGAKSRLASLLDPASQTYAGLPSATHFVAFEVDEAAIQGPDYLLDFSDKRLPYRYNSAGVYGQQRSEQGLTFVMAEIPCHPGKWSGLNSDDTADAAWQSLLDTGYLNTDCIRHDTTQWHSPVAFVLPLVNDAGAGDTAANTDDEGTVLNALNERVVFAESVQRGRNAVIDHFDNTLMAQLI